MSARAAQLVKDLIQIEREVMAGRRCPPLVELNLRGNQGKDTPHQEMEWAQSMQAIRRP